MPSIADWQVQRLRVTTFAQEPLPSAQMAEEWWPLVTSVDGEQTTQRRQVVEKRVQIDDPSIGSPQLVLQVQPHRAEIRLEPGADDTGPLLYLGPYDSVFPQFRSRIQSWVDHLPPSRRVAFGVTLALPVDTEVAAYERLGQLLRFPLRPGIDSDLIFRINRPRPWPANPEITLNRLSNWASVRWERRPLIPSGNDPESEDLGVAVRLELDLNSKPIASGAFSFDSDTVGALVDHLYELSAEIAREGDVE